MTPRLVFEDRLNLHFGERELFLEFRPGPSPGASWLVDAASNVLFVGDAVTRNQPPFLALANIPQWVETLDRLLGAEYKNFRVISGRGGEVKVESLRAQRRFLKDVESRLERLAKRKAALDDVDKLVPKLMHKYKYPSKFRTHYSRRLSFGLKNYYRRLYRPSLKTALQ